MTKFPAGARVLYDGDLATVVYGPSNTGLVRIQFDAAGFTQLAYGYDLKLAPAGLAVYPVPPPAFGVGGVANSPEVLR